MRIALLIPMLLSMAACTVHTYEPAPQPTTVVVPATGPTPGTTVVPTPPPGGTTIIRSP
jgi:hypothetical protein